MSRFFMSRLSAAFLAAFALVPALAGAAPAPEAEHFAKPPLVKPDAKVLPYGRLSDLTASYTLGRGSDSCYVACYAATGLADLQRGEGAFLVGLMRMRGRYGTKGTCEPLACRPAVAGDDAPFTLACTPTRALDHDRALAALCQDAFGDPQHPDRTFWAGGDTARMATPLSQMLVHVERDNQHPVKADGTPLPRRR